MSKVLSLIAVVVMPALTSAAEISVGPADLLRYQNGVTIGRVRVRNESDARLEDLRIEIKEVTAFGPNAAVRQARAKHAEGLCLASVRQEDFRRDNELASFALNAREDRVISVIAIQSAPGDRDFFFQTSSVNFRENGRWKWDPRAAIPAGGYLIKLAVTGDDGSYQEFSVMCNRTKAGNSFELRKK